MQKKICTKCQQEREETDFAFQNKSLGKRHAQCKTCHKKYTVNHYINNKDKYLAYANKYNPIYYARGRKLVDEYKLKRGCVYCGMKELCCLDFHHKGDKKFNIASSLFLSVEALKKEIAKCQVVCSNCHRKIHAGVIQEKEGAGGPPSFLLNVNQCWCL